MKSIAYQLLVTRDKLSFTLFAHSSDIFGCDIAKLDDFTYSSREILALVAKRKISNNDKTTPTTYLGIITAS
jgi:hypothetical protein